MKTLDEIKAAIQRDPIIIYALLATLANEFETEGCDGCGTVTIATMNRVRAVLGHDPLPGGEEEDD